MFCETIISYLKERTYPRYFISVDCVLHILIVGGFIKFNLIWFDRKRSLHIYFFTCFHWTFAHKLRIPYTYIMFIVIYFHHADVRLSWFHIIAPIQYHKFCVTHHHTPTHIPLSWCVFLPFFYFRSDWIACHHVGEMGINYVFAFPIQIDQIRKDVPFDVEPCSGYGVGAVLLCARGHSAIVSAMESTHIAHATQSVVWHGTTVAHTSRAAKCTASTHLPQEEWWW